MYEIDQLLETYKIRIDNRDTHYRTNVRKVLNLADDNYSEERKNSEDFLRAVVFETEHRHDESIEIMRSANMSKDKIL